MKNYNLLINKIYINLFEVRKKKNNPPSIYVLTFCIGIGNMETSKVKIKSAVIGI